MRKKYLSGRLALILIIGCVARPARSQDWKSVTIPDSLKQGASMVKRMDLTEIEILSPRKARIHHKYAYTVLSPAGDRYGVLYTFYDKFNDLTAAAGALYDGEGKMLKKIKKNEMEDWSTEGSGMLMTDTRIKIYRFTPGHYPYTVSFDEETELNGLFVLPQWQPQPSAGIAVEDCRLVISAPADYPLHYSQSHLPGDVTVTSSGKDKTLSWEMKERRAVFQDPFAPSWSERIPCVKLAPVNFEIGGYKGSQNSWRELGLFVGTLFRGRDQLPEEARAKVHALTDGLKDDREKIEVLYGFLQKNTHYVGIELGIGGWQPYDANYVYTKRYGDCKALSNYMVALLKEAGIRASNVLIRGGLNEPAVDTAFVSSQFNHMIAVAYAGRDSIWLECTSSVLPAGYLGGFTADRYGLLLDPTGGFIVHTPVYGARENHVIHLTTGTIDSTGALQAHLNNRYSGMSQDALQSMVDRLSPKELSEQRRLSGPPGCLIAGLFYTKKKDSVSVPVLEESMTLSDDHYATISQSRIFFTPGSFLRREGTLTEGSRSRTTEMEIPGVEEKDTVVFRIPAGYEPEGHLPSENYSSPFGAYHIHCNWDGTTLTLISYYRQNKGTYPATSWAPYVRMKNIANRESIRQLIFVKKG